MFTPTETFAPPPPGTPTETPTATWTATPSDDFALSGNTFQPGSGDVFVIHYKVSSPGRYSLRIFNSAGELVKVLQNLESKWPVEDDVPWDGKNEMGEYVAAGVYIVYFESQRYMRIAKFLVLH